MEKKRNDKPAAEKREKDALPVQQAEKALFAYLRVSSREQSWDRQRPARILTGRSIKSCEKGYKPEMC